MDFFLSVGTCWDSTQGKAAKGFNLSAGLEPQPQSWHRIPGWVRLGGPTGLTWDHPRAQGLGIFWNIINPVRFMQERCLKQDLLPQSHEGLGTPSLQEFRLSCPWSVVTRGLKG